jgi:gamma-glutamyl-gamma-aminobutyrate hydrolase PuuD
MHRLHRRAAEILKHANGLLVPGGEDIEPCLYKRSAEPTTVSYRSLLELALLTEADRRKIPTMGVCRGAQMINVYFGGTLLEHVKGQSGIHALEWTNSAYQEKLRRRLPDEVSGLSMHHQAVDEVGNGLHVVLKRGPIPKLLVSENGNFIASQIHPENYIREIKKFTSYYHVTPREYTERDLAILHSVYLELQKRAQELQKNYPDSPLVAGCFERFNESFLQNAKLIEFIFANKSIYQFFMNKVERFKNRLDK